MRFIILFFCFLFFISCKKEIKFEKPTWLLGKWIRTNNDSIKTTYEFWDQNFSGLGFTLQNKDTVFIEKMNIISNKGLLYLSVIGIGETPTYFAFTEQTTTSFTVENDRNEFPKKIKYYKDNDTLKAVISNKDFSVDFNFIKMNDN